MIPKIMLPLAQCVLSAYNLKAWEAEEQEFLHVLS